MIEVRMIEVRMIEVQMIEVQMIEVRMIEVQMMVARFHPGQALEFWYKYAWLPLCIGRTCCSPFRTTLKIEQKISSL